MATQKKQPKQGQELLAADYLAAAEDLLAAIPALYIHGNHALLIYTSGLSVECMLRAYRMRKGLPFRSDHALGPIAEEAGLPDLLPETDRERYDAALATLIVGWRNLHRFRSKEAMRRFLKGLKLDRGIQGDFVKENARRISSAAYDLVGLGVQRWQKQ